MPEPSQFVIPATGAVPDVVTNTIIPTDWGNAIGAASRGRVVQRFNSTAERDSAITTPVAGMVCYVAATDLFYGYRTATGWTVLIGGPRDTTHARVWQNGAWNSATGAPVAMGFDSVDYDPLGMWSSPARKFTVPVAGIYLLAALISCTFTTGTQGEIQAWRNGGAIAGGNNGANGPYGRARILLSVSVRCAAGDGLSVAFFTGPAALTGNTGSTETFASLDYLGTG
jgi:hypothetical protein